jgi:hypothetical protein
MCPVVFVCVLVLTVLFLSCLEGTRGYLSH